MRTIAHISDLHFGRVDPRLIPPLVAAIKRLSPDLVAVSGDLTQRARRNQFRRARLFLDSLPAPQIVVPGNHDVPLHNVFARFLHPLAKYRRYITDDLEPFYHDDEIAVAGVNTARSLTIEGGRINLRQIERLRLRLRSCAPEATKIIVTHHPFELPAGYARDRLVGRAALAVEALAACGADLLLSGHLHLSYTASTAVRYPLANRAALVVQAGTATSTRGRGETNSFNVIRVARRSVVVTRWQWRPEAGDFFAAEAARFGHGDAGWHSEGGFPPA